MGALSAKLRNIGTEADKRVAFWCPGCKMAHQVRIAGDSPVWGWDGNVDAPTFTPSVLVTIPWSRSVEPGDDPAEWRDQICHSFVRAGKIEFLGDCTHELKGQTVPLPDWPSSYSDGDQEP